jgi:hypothetical protein
VDDQHRAFREEVAASRLQDPMPALRNLAAFTQTELDDVVHHALVRWTAAGSEALLSLEPRVLRQLIEARRAKDWVKVGGIVDWLAAAIAGEPAGDRPDSTGGAAGETR